MSTESVFVSKDVPISRANSTSDNGEFGSNTNQDGAFAVESIENNEFVGDMPSEDVEAFPEGKAI